MRTAFAIGLSSERVAMMPLVDRQTPLKTLPSLAPVKNLATIVLNLLWSNADILNIALLLKFEKIIWNYWQINFLHKKMNKDSIV